MNEHIETNRRHWDELVPVHVASDYYDVAGFKAGGTALKPTELEELGDVRGKTMLHLQCHFGLDTLSWAREGAIVTGTDFSERAIETARSLAAECGIEASFITSDVYGLPERLDEQFDIVFTSYGALFWLPDIERWAQVAGRYVRPGGTLYLVEFHPIAGIFDVTADLPDVTVLWPYFSSPEPLRFEEDGSYADRSATLRHRTTYSWPHPVSDVLTALIDAGLRIEFFHEFPFSVEPYMSDMRQTDRHVFRLSKHDGSIPLLYSIKATRD